VLAKDQTLGKYQILDRLGSGGFGSVYLALDTWINRKVAIKVPHQQEEEVIEMIKEPRIMSELKKLKYCRNDYSRANKWNIFYGLRVHRG